MRLIEKKCPNCGASLEFNETDKSCKCAYCNRSFEIERDMAKESIDDQFDLKPSKAISAIFIVIIVVFLLVFCLIFATIFLGFNNTSKSDSFFDSANIDSFFNKDSEDKLISSVSDLSNSDISSIDSDSTMLISNRGEGVNDTYHSYTLAGKKLREKLYVAYKKDSNYIITIYKAVYHDFFHQENQFTVYVPIVFENVNQDVVFSLGDGKVQAPEYYFNSEKTSYTYGYGSFEEAYNSVVKPLEEEYTITEK